MASRALPKTSANTTQPIAIGLTIHPLAAVLIVSIVHPSESEGGGEDRPLHVNVEAQIAVARLVIKVEAAVAQMKVQPRGGGVVDRADQLPVDMRAEAEAADIAIGAQAEAVCVFQVAAPTEERIAPAGRAIDARSGKDPGVQGQ